MLKTGRTAYQRSQGSGLHNLQALKSHEFSAVSWEELRWILWKVGGRKLDQDIFNILMREITQESSKQWDNYSVCKTVWCQKRRVCLREGILHWNWVLVLTLDRTAYWENRLSCVSCVWGNTPFTHLFSVLHFSTRTFGLMKGIFLAHFLSPFP